VGERFIDKSPAVGKIHRDSQGIDCQSVFRICDFDVGSPTPVIAHRYPLVSEHEYLVYLNEDLERLAKERD